MAWNMDAAIDGVTAEKGTRQSTTNALCTRTASWIVGVLVLRVLFVFD